MINHDLQAALNLAVQLQAKKDFGSALIQYDQVLAEQPDNWEVVRMKSGCLDDMRRFDEALKLLKPALAHEPNHPGGHISAGLILHRAGDLQAAGYHYRRALECSPTLRIAQWNMALWEICQGDVDPDMWRRGWERYEWCKGMKLRPKDHPNDEWDGRYLGAGKRLYIRWEQGLGDIVQFVRLLPRVKEVSGGAHIILEVQEPLVDLLCDLPDVTEVVAWQHGGAFACQFDAHISIMSLIHVLGLSVDGVRAEPYLTHVADAVPTVPKDKPNIGVCWKGSPSHANDENRSIPWDKFRAAFDGVDARLWSLVPGETPDGVEPLTGRTMRDTANLIAAMDVIVTVDTCVCHVAGAMGKKVYTLIPSNPDFRWFYNRPDTPWYDTMRLFRQERYGDWASALKAVNDTLNTSPLRERPTCNVPSVFGPIQSTPTVAAPIITISPTLNPLTGMGATTLNGTRAEPEVLCG